MAVTSASFKVRFPEFDSVDDTRVDLFISDAVDVLNESFWVDKYDLGVSYLAAHYLSLSIRTDAGVANPANPIVGKSADGVSVSYASPVINDGSDSYYQATAYGQRYLALRGSLPIAAFTV